MTAPSKLLSDLLSYIVEQAKEINPEEFRLANSALFKRDAAQLTGMPGVHLNVQGVGDHVWLQVDRLSEVPPPVDGIAKEPLLRFIRIPNDPDRHPEMNAEAVKAAVAAEAKKPDSDPVAFITQLRAGIEDLLGRYKPAFDAWATEERPRRKSISLYSELFALISILKTSNVGKPLQLVWGVGVSAWQLTYKKRGGDATFGFQYPLMTQVVEMTVNDETLAVEVRPAIGSPRFEFDAFAFCQVPNVAEVEKAAKQLHRDDGSVLNPFAPSTFEPVLRLAAGGLHERGSYAAKAQALPLPGTDLVVSDAWVLFCRPRPTNFVVEDIERLKERIEAGDAIPVGSEALVTFASGEKQDFVPVSFRGLCGTSGSAAEVRELYAPLPYNREQVTIVEALERSAGCAVQGPPGTGKTHTIANVICHYLALGKRVLVTSRGEQALEVLRAKIPESIRPLTVGLLAGDREGMREFQSSIETILHTVSQLNPDLYREEIQRIRADIDATHRGLAEVDRRVDELATSQLSDFEVDGVPMRAAKMAEMVMEGESLYEWFQDRLRLIPEHELPLTDSQVAALREARRKLGLDLDLLDSTLPLASSLPSLERLMELDLSGRQGAGLRKDLAAGELWSLKAPGAAGIAARKKLSELVAVMTTQLEELDGLQQTWIDEVRGRLGGAFFVTERDALAALSADAAALVAARAEFMQKPVELPEAALSKGKVREAIERGATTGKPFGMFAMGVADAKAQLAEVRVAGLAAETQADWAHVLEFAKLHDRVLSFSVRWKQVAEPLGMPLLGGGVLSLRNTELVTTAALKLLALVDNGDKQLPQAFAAVFRNGPSDLGRASLADLIDIQQHLHDHAALEALAENEAELAGIRERAANWSGRLAEELRQFVMTVVGSAATAREETGSIYARHLAELHRIEGLSDELDLVDEAYEALEGAGAELLSQAIIRQPLLGGGEDTILPHTLRHAWTYSRLRTRLAEIEGRDELLQLAARRRELERNLSRLYIDLSAKSAWLNTKLNASPRVLAALETYKSAVRRIGQGTGANADRHRRDAQEAMLQAQGAIPCWVMSQAKVSETLPSLLGAFDLVVVDEASQSDLSALPAVVRGKKILVVGDDKQTSPSEGFVSSAWVQDLRDRYLADQPHASLLTHGNSLYDLAATVFAANKVMLLEHFRCVPAIIHYSNRFYGGAMQPLRLPKASERLDPPLIDVLVRDGFRERKHDVNKAEADFIVEEIGRILADPKMAGRSLGVVSLLGSDQGKHIDERVRGRYDAQELRKRDFLVGDPREFQGGERDVIFLTMVVDPQQCRALSGNLYEQRFNVAASRARDRMYLVRSVSLSDLSQTDIRRGLVEHFSSPLEAAATESAGEMADLSHKCDSYFEKDVYRMLCDRGFRVTPQVKAGAYRIDLVVEGGQDSRLAIELDGDDFHGPDRWPADMARQRVLERAGWTFWRCFASTWTLKREEVFAELLDRLRTMGIEPLGALEYVPSLVEFRQISQGKPYPSVDNDEVSPREAELVESLFGGPTDIAAAIQTKEGLMAAELAPVASKPSELLIPKL